MTHREQLEEGAARLHARSLVHLRREINDARRSAAQSYYRYIGWSTMYNEARYRDGVTDTPYARRKKR